MSVSDDDLNSPTNCMLKRDPTVKYADPTVNYANVCYTHVPVNANNVAESLQKCPFGSLLSFIHIMYCHLMGLDLGWNKGPRVFSKFASCNLKGNNFNQNILPYV